MKNGLLSEALQLPCGVELPNRLAKAAMTEGLATPEGVPTPALNTLYRHWSAAGAGLLLTGNVIVDRDHLERPGNVVIDREPDPEMAQALAAWAQACTVGGNQAWVQLSHAGRQTMKTVNPHPRAPSAVKLGLPGGQFGVPVALTVEEIAGLVERFAVAARAVCSAAFRSMRRMATCFPSSSARAATSGATRMGAAWKTGRGCCYRSWRRCATRLARRWRWR